MSLTGAAVYHIAIRRKEMVMLNQPVTHSVVTPTATVLPSPAANPFAEITGHAGLIASEFSYKKDEEIHGEDEPAEYVYQVISGAVRSYKLLSDGRRQIGAFHLPGDVFGLEFGSSHRLAAEAIIDTNVRLVKRRSLEQAASVDVAVADRKSTRLNSSHQIISYAVF